MSELGNVTPGAGYISSKAAAAAFGVTNDYVSRLCRSGKVNGVLEGREWLIETKSLSAFFGKELPGSVEAPIKIYYKDTPTVQTVPAAPLQISKNPAVLSIAPLELRPRKSFVLIPQNAASLLARGVVAAVLVLVLGTFGYGSVTNGVPLMASKLDQVAATQAGEFLSSVSAFFKNLFDRDSDAAPSVIVKVPEQKPAAVTPPVVQQQPVAQQQQQIQQPAKVAQTIINNPVIERVIERERLVFGGGISEAYLQSNLDALDVKLRSLIFASSASASAGSSAVYNVITQTNRIDTLDDVDVTNSRITRSTISDSTFSNATLSGTTNLDTLTIGNSTTTSGGGFDISSGCYAVNGVCITGGGSGTPGGSNSEVQFNNNGSFSGVSTFTFSTTSDRLLLTNASTTNLSIAGGITGAGLASCSGSLDKIQYDSSTRQFVCATDQTGGGGGSDTNWSFFNNSGLRPATTTNQVLIGGIATTTNAKLQVIGGGVIDNATTTAINTNLLGIGGTSYFNSLTGNGLQNSAGVLTVNQGQAFSTTSVAYWDSTQTRWATTSTEYWRSQTNFYSTSSADFWKTQNNFFSTSSASAFLALNQGAAFSTTSVAYFASNGLAFSTTSASAFLAQNQGNAFSTTSAAYNLATYDKGYFFSTTSVTFWDSTQSRWATTSAQYFLSQNQGLAFSTSSANFYASVGLAFSSTSASYFLSQNQGEAFSTTSTAAHLSTIDKGYFFSTTSSDSWLTTKSLSAFSTSSALYYSSLGLAFSTTSTDYWKTQNNFFSTTSAAFFASNGLAFSTTSASAFLAQNQGNAFSTSSAAFNLAAYDKGYFFSTTSVAFWDSTQFRWATTSSDAWLATKSTSNLSEGSNLYYTPERVAGVITASTTIAKTNVDNTFTGTNSFQNITATGATTTSLFANIASTTNLLAGNATTSILYIGNSIAGAGLTSCSAGAEKLLWNASTRQFECGADAGAGGGITALNAQYSSAQVGSSQTFATSSDTNLALTITSAGNIHTFAPSWVGTLAGSRGGTGISSVSQNGLLIGGAGNTWSQVSTSSLGINSDNIVEGSNQFYTDGRVQTYLNGVNKGFFYSTSSMAYDLSTYDKGYFFSTTSVNYWEGTQNRWATTSAQYFLSQNQGLAFSTSSASFFASSGLAYSTSSANFYSSVGLAFSTTSASYFLSQNTGASFATSSALFFSSVGLAHSTTSVAYQLTQTPVFSNGFTAFSSSTIGNGTATGGLTISGGATTTGDSNFTGNLTTAGVFNFTPTLGTSTFLKYNNVPLLTASSTAGNFSFGLGALRSVTSGIWNVAVGESALRLNTTGNSNVAVGRSAFSSITSATSSVAIGTGAGQGIGTFTAEGLTLVGYAAGINFGSNNSYNTMIGHSAGSSMITGQSNILVGANVGGSGNLNGGYGNVGLANNAYFPVAAGSNQLNIGNLIYGSVPATSTGFVLPTSGTVGIGTSSPTSRFGVALNNGGTLTTAFEISSSTANSTTTLFSIGNTGSTTAANGFNITAGCYAINGTCLSAGAADGTFSTTSASYFSSLGLAFSTTSTDYWKTQNNFFSTTSALFFSSVGLAHSTSSVAYQLTQTPVMTNGLLAYASSTIGNGTAVGGLTISGGATTTGNAFFGGFINATSTLGTTTFFTLGGQSFITATSGPRNTGVGYGALASHISGSSDNTAFGYGALSRSLSGSSNTAIGSWTLLNATTTTSSDNTAVGRLALRGDPTAGLTGAQNTAIGSSALLSISTGSQNVAIGYSTMPFVARGSRNTAIGSSAGSTGGQDTTGGDNVFVGYLAGSNVQGGYANILVGANTTFGNTIVNGAGNVGVGNNLRFASDTNNQLNIGNLIFGSLPATSTAWLLPTSGTVGIGTTSPTSIFGISANNGNTLPMLFQISSSTANSTTTLFSINNRGQVLIGGSAATTTTLAIGQMAVLPSTTTVVRIASTTQTGTGFGKAIQGNYLYIAGFATTNGFEIFDISNPTLPTRVGQASFTNNGVGVAVQGRYAYTVENAAQDTFKIWDISNPAAPVLLSQSSMTQTAASIKVSGNYAYLVSGNSGVNFEIWDVSNPMAPKRVSANSLSSFGRNVVIQGRYAYFANNASSFEIWDVANPAAPIRMSLNVLNVNGRAIHVQGRYAYLVGSGGNNSFEIWDVSNPAAPVRSSINTLASSGSGGQDVFVQGRYAYVTGFCCTKNFEVWDVSSTTAAFRVALNSTANTPNLIVQGRYAYLTNTTLEVWDLGGAYISQLEAGGIETGTLAVRNNLTAGDGMFQGGLNIVNSLNVGGTFALNAFNNSTTTVGRNYSIFSVGTASSTAITGNSTTSIPFLNISYNGNIGVGTTSNHAKFSLQNNYGSTNTNLFEISSSTSADGNAQNSLFAIGTTGSTTAANGFNISSGCYAINGTCLTSGGSSASSTLLSDTNRFSGLNIFNAGLLSLASTTIGNGTQIGGLTISGGATTTGNAYIAGTLGIGTPTSTQTLDINGSLGVGLSGAGGRITISTFTQNVTNDSIWFNLPSSGASGIGSGGAGVNPWIAYAGQNGYYFNNATAGDIAYRNTTGRLLFGNEASAAALSITGSRIGIGNVSPSYLLDVYSSARATSTDLLRVATTTGAGLYVTNNGNVGVGTSTPNAKFSIFAQPTDRNTSVFNISSSTGNATTTLFSISNTGSTTIASLLNVMGTASSTFAGGVNVGALNITSSATSTAARGFNIASGCYAINGTCIGSSGGGSGTVASGLAGQLALYAADGTTVTGTSTFGFVPNLTFNTPTSSLNFALFDGSDSAGNITYGSHGYFGSGYSDAEGFTKGGTISLLTGGVLLNDTSEIYQRDNQSGSFAIGYDNASVGSNDSDFQAFGSYLEGSGGGTFDLGQSIRGGDVNVRGGGVYATSSNTFDELRGGGLTFTAGGAQDDLTWGDGAYFSLGGAVAPSIGSGIPRWKAGDVYIAGGSGSTGDIDGGDVYISSGFRGATGSNGKIYMHPYLIDDNLYDGGAMTIDPTLLRVGIGTSTPTAQFEIFAHLDFVNPTLFKISSTTADGTSTSSVTHLSINNKGQALFGGNATTTPVGQLSVLPGTTTGKFLTDLGGFSNPVAVVTQGRYAYMSELTAKRINVIDISNPASPVILSQVSAGMDWVTSLAVQGNYLYAVSQATGEVVVFNVSNPNAPARIGSIGGFSTPADIVVQGRYAYVTDANFDLFAILDISNPSNPVLAGYSTDIIDNPSQIQVQGTYAYVVSFDSSTLYIYDVSNPAKPVRVGQESSVGTYTNGLYVQGNYAYTVGQFDSSFVITNISNPADPTVVSYILPGNAGANGVFVQGRYAYVKSNNDRRLTTIDVSNPAAPIVVNEILVNEPPAGNKFSVQGRYAYFTTQFGSTFTVVDLGGAYINQLETGGIETGTLAVRNGITAMDASLWGALNVGSSLNVAGGASFTYTGTTTKGTGAQIFSINHATTTIAAGATSSSPIFTALANSNIGIGTSSPISNLSIQNNYGSSNASVFSISSSTNAAGTTNSSLFSIGNTGSTTAANGFNITSGCYAINGTCLTTGGGAASTTILSDANTWGGLATFSAGLRSFASSTIGNGTAIGGLTISGGATTTGNAYFASNVSIGTTTSVFALNVTGNAASAVVAGLQNTSSSGYAGLNLVDNTGIAQTSFAYGNASAPIAANTAFFGTNAKNFLLSNSLSSANPNLVMHGTTGNIGIGTSTPYAKLSVVGNVVADTFYATSTTATSTFNGGLNVGNGAIVYDYSSGQTSIQNLALGSMSFDADSGVVTWNDMPVTSVSATGTPQSYHAAIDGTALLSLYSESDGSGGIKNIGVGVGSTTPWANLVVQKNYGDTKASIFTVGSSTIADGSNANSFLSVSASGFGTTTVSGLNVSGSATSTSNVGFNITSGCYAVNGTCLTAGGAFASTTLLTDANTFTGNLTFSQATSTTFFATTASSTNLSAATAAFGTLTVQGVSTIGGNTLSSQNITVGNIGKFVHMDGNGLTIKTGLGLRFTSGNADQTADGAFTRLGSGRIALGNGSNGNTTGTLVLGQLGFAATTSTSTLATFADRSFIIASTSASNKGGNLGFGLEALSRLTNGYYNTAFGESALRFATTTRNSVAVGFHALENDFAGWGLAGQAGNNNTAVGSYALYVTSGSDNTAIGQSAMSAVFTGSNNVAIGSGALLGGGSVSTGSNNVGIGKYAVGGGYDILGSSNVGIGMNAMGFEQIRGTGNVAVGELAGVSIAQGGYNTFLGYSAGASVGFAQINGSNNIAIGPSTFLASSTASNQLNIGNLIFGTLPATSTAWSLPTSGSVGVGTTSPTARFGIALNDGGTLRTAFLISSSTANATSTLFIVDNAGRVGIGTSTPFSQFAINTGDVSAFNGAVCADNGGSAKCFSALTPGVVYGDSSSFVASDVAEQYQSSDATLVAGEIVTLDLSTSTTVKRAALGDKPLGVVSTQPGVLLGDETPNSVPLALAGRVPLVVNSEGGAIRVGDAISLSSVAGIGMKATTTSYTVGTALEAFSGTGTSSILVFVQTGYTIQPNLLRSLSLESTSTPALIAQNQLASASVTLRGAIAALQDAVVRTFNTAISATSGIFEKIFAKEVHTDKLCVADDNGETCITKAQLDALLAGAAVPATQTTPTPAPTPVPTPTPSPDSETAPPSSEHEEEVVASADQPDILTPPADEILIPIELPITTPTPEVTE